MKITPKAYIQAIKSEPVMLVVGDQEIPTHAALLGLNSEYFGLILSTNSGAKTEDGKIILSNVSSTTVEHYVHWCNQTSNVVFPIDAPIEQLQETKAMLIDLWIFADTYAVARLQNEVMAALCALLGGRPLLLTKVDITSIFQRVPASYSPLRKLAAFVLVAQAQAKNSPIIMEDFDKPVFGGMASMIYNSLHIWLTCPGLDKKKARLPQLLEVEGIRGRFWVHEPEPAEWALRLCGLAPVASESQSGVSQEEPIELD